MNIVHRRKLLILGALSLVSAIGCDSEETLEQSALYGRWEWVQTFQVGMAGSRKITPDDVGYNLYMNIGNTDTIQHFRNDTLVALSVITYRKLYSDHIDMEHGFIDSLQLSDGYEIIHFPREAMTYKKDSINTSTLAITDFSASSTYTRIY